MKTGAAGRYEPCGARFSGIIGVSDAGMDEFGADPVHGGGTRAASGSTDEGVSFCVDFAGVTLFHAGDLNLWHWRDESSVTEIESAQRAFYERA